MIVYLQVLTILLCVILERELIGYMGERNKMIASLALIYILSGPDFIYLKTFLYIVAIRYKGFRQF